MEIGRDVLVGGARVEMARKGPAEKHVVISCVFCLLTSVQSAVSLLKPG